MPLVSTPFLINTKFDNTQTLSESALLIDGRIVVVWMDQNSDFGIWQDVRGRIFNADGSPSGSDFIVNSEVADLGTSFRLSKHQQSQPAVAALANGGFAVIYQDGRETIEPTSSTSSNIRQIMVVQRYNADGTKDGVDTGLTPPTEILGVSNVSPFHPDIAGTPNGGYLAAYQTTNFPLALASTADDQGIVLQSVDPTFVSGGYSNANTTAPGTQSRPELAAQADGTVLAVWMSNSFVYDELGRIGGELKGQLFSQTGFRIGGEISIPNGGIPLQGSGASKLHDVAALAGGGFAVTWVQPAAASSALTNIRAQLLNADGSMAGGIIAITADVGVRHSLPSIAGGADGGFLIAWNTFVANFPPTEVLARLFKADGSLSGAQIQVNPNGRGQNPDATAMANGGYLVTWDDDILARGDVSDSSYNIVGAIVFPDSIVTGTSGPDKLGGTGLPDILNGQDGNDVLFGLAGNDTLNGGLGDDILYGGAGDDSMVGGEGDDQYLVEQLGDIIVELLNQGNDTIFLFVTGFLMNLGIDIARLIAEATTVTGSSDPEQIVANPMFASLIRGEGGDDVLWGGNLAHTLEGGAGDDIFRPQDGAARMVGGIGDDAYVVGNIGCVIVENANEGFDTVFVTVNDYVLSSNIEVTYLSGGATRVTGSSTSENLVANVGAASFLSGEGGNDTLWGSTQADTMFGGVGDDIMRGQGGADLMTGGIGNDSYVVFDKDAIITEFFGEGYDIAYVGGAGRFFIGENVEEARLIDTGNHLVGNGLGNLLVGNNAGLASTIDAAGGNDIVFGTPAGDTIIGGAGDDIIYTLGGADRLVYSAPGWGIDQVADLSLADGGRVQFQAGSGVTSFAQLGINSAGGNTQINHQNGIILLFGVASVTPGDFIFG